MFYYDLVVIYFILIKHSIESETLGNLVIKLF